MIKNHKVLEILLKKFNIELLQPKKKRQFQFYRKKQRVIPKDIQDLNFFVLML
jgi:hypothetical protein